MLFNSNIFIFLFLPIFIIGYWIVTRWNYRTSEKAWILVGSLVFYCWWDPKYFFLILGSISVNFLISHWILTINQTSRINGRRALLLLGIGLNLSILGYYRYTDFFIDYTNRIFGLESSFLDLALPLAISFFTFQQIAYLIESYKGNTATESFLTYACFVTFFPQLIAGPIVYHSEMIPQFTGRRKPFPNFDRLSNGLFIFSIGLAMKSVIADSLSKYSDYGFQNAQNLSVFEAWLATFSFSLQIYFDFAGYSTMAIGLALLIGLKLPINFDRPYLSTGIQEFWRRWHITLGRFFRDYLYIPLGGNRSGYWRTCINVMTVFILGGFWHGAALTFILWGCLIGLGIVFQGYIQSFNVRINRWAAWISTLLFMNIVWVFFRATTLPKAFQMLKSMFGFNERTSNVNEYSPSGFMDFVNLIPGDSIIGPVLIVILGFIVALKLDTTWNGLLIKSFDVKKIIATIFLLVISILMLNWGDPREFIYFNF